MSTNGQPLTPQNAGYFDGVTDVYYALMESPDLMNQAPVYGTPKVAGKAIEISVTPNYKEGKVYASNAGTRREQRVESCSVALNLDQVIPERRAELLGRQTGSDGVEVVTGKRAAPAVALLYAATLDDGTQEYRTLYKGRFSEPTNTHHTENDGDSYQHPTIQGVFTPLDGSGIIGAARSDGYVAGQNLLRGTTGMLSANPAGLNMRPTQAPVIAFSETGQALTNGDTTNTYVLSFKYRTAGPNGSAAPSGISGSFSVFLKSPAGSHKLGDTVTLSGAVTEWATFTCTKVLTAAQAAAGARSITFSGSSLSPTTGWVLQITDMKLEQGSTATGYAPAPEDWFDAVELYPDPDTLLSQVSVFRNTTPAIYAQISPPINDRDTEYTVTGTKTANNQTWYFYPDKFADDAVITYLERGSSTISTSILSSGERLNMILTGGAVDSDGDIRLRVSKGGRATEYTFHLHFAYET